jgi:UDP-N-acetylglucosamine 2-epimerase
MTKMMTVVGTRPKIIRPSEAIKRLDATVDHVLVHTGQNYDYELNGIFFEKLGLRQRDHFLGVKTSNLGRVLVEVLINTEQVLLQEKPDAFRVLGDTNSCIPVVMAKRLRIPVYHVLLGVRCAARPLSGAVPTEYAIANCSKRVVNYLGLHLLASRGVGRPERPDAVMNPSAR